MVFMIMFTETISIQDVGWEVRNVSKILSILWKMAIFVCEFAYV